MTKKRIAKILVCVVCLVAVLGYGVYAYRSWRAYQQEKEIMTSGETSENIELFHDQGDIYMSPVAPTEKDDVTIRMRCGRYNTTKAQIQVTTDEGTTWKCYEMSYEKPDETGYYDIWVGEIPAQSEPYFYRFAVANDTTNTTMYLGTEGMKSYQVDTNEMFYVIPGFDTPKWSQGTMWYYAHIGQFYNGDTSNDLYREYLMKDSAYGNDASSMYRGSGDIVGLQEKLDYIQELGVSSLAVGPFFSSSETLGFGTDNMAAVETAFGTEEELKTLIDEVHDRDMRITTDMILSYATSYSKYFNAYGLFPEDGAYQSQDSQYYNLFRFPQWPYNAVKVWGSIGLNIADSEAAKLIYQNKDSMVLRYLNDDYGLDGFRFDAEESVGNLGFEYEPETYLAGITNAIKGVSDEKLVLAENCTGIADQYNTLFDSSWQKNGYFAMKGWFEGTSTGSEMLKVMQDNLINTARPRALSSYNFLGQHDVNRMWDDTEAQKNDINALLLMQMTYLGSPVVYYGDEIGLTNGYYDNQRYSAFNWDESEWDYDILNMVKTLGKARQEYSCLRNGVICQGEVDDAQMFLAFGRFDDNGSAITLCNKQGVVVQREINVSRYNVCDGETLTDYLTGQTYKVKNGKVTVDIIPGGTLLVTGKNSSETRNQYTISNIGKNIEVVQKDEKVFEITGKGSLNGKKDKVGLLEVKASNNMAFSADIDAGKGAKAALMLRDDNEKDSAFYGAVLRGNKVTVQSRNQKAANVKDVTTLSVTEGSQIQVVRESGNLFVLYYRENADADWKRIEESACYVAMGEDIYAGMTVLGGTATFSQVTLDQMELQICENFEEKMLGSMFGTMSDSMEIKAGQMVMNSSKDVPVFLKANAHSSDFTFKTEITKFETVKGSEIPMAGVFSMADDRDMVVLVRTVIDEEQVIAFGKMVNGKWQLAGTVKDTMPNSNIVLQLQRIGSLYTAVASYDGESWFTVGDSLYCNYTGNYVGLYTLNAKATYEYACFGNSIEDSVSTNTPMTLGIIETDMASVLQNIEADKMSYLGNEKNWKDIGAGYEQTNESGLALLYCQNKKFEDVKVETTITLNGGKGSAGILLGKQDYTKDTKDCYQISIDKTKELTISLNGKEIGACKLKIKEDAIRLVVRRENGYIHVFAGSDADLVFSVYDKTYAEGYVAYFTDDVKASFTNYDITALKSVWNSTGTVMGTKDVMELLGSDSLISLEGVGITKGVVTFQADIDHPEDKESKIGVILGGSFGRKSGYGGMSIMYDYKTGVLEALEGEASLGKAKLANAEGMKSLSLMVVYRDGKYDIYANQSSEPVLTAETKKPNGGGVSLYSSNSSTLFYNVGVCDITGTTNVEELELVKEWRATATQPKYTLGVVDASGTTYSDNFDDYMGWQKNFYKIKVDGADWYLDNGMLKADSIIRNWNIATITSGLYDDVDISMKVRFADFTEDNNSAFSINVGKQEVYAGRDDTGLAFTIFGSGLVRVYDTETKQTLNGWSTYVDDLDQWFEMRVKVNKGTVTLSIDGVELYNGKVDTLKNGYIALQSDYVNLEVDDISIKPLS